MLALNYNKISNHPQRISNLLPFISNYDWDEIHFPAGSKEYSAFKKYNDTIALNIFYVPYNKKKKDLFIYLNLIKRVNIIQIY